jgi:hypothetical protein
MACDSVAEGGMYDSSSSGQFGSLLTGRETACSLWPNTVSKMLANLKAFAVSPDNATPPFPQPIRRLLPRMGLVGNVELGCTRLSGSITISALVGTNDRFCVTGFVTANAQASRISSPA